MTQRFYTPYERLANPCLEKDDTNDYSKFRRKHVARLYSELCKMYGERFKVRDNALENANETRQVIREYWQPHEVTACHDYLINTAYPREKAARENNKPRYKDNKPTIDFNKRTITPRETVEDMVDSLPPSRDDTPRDKAWLDECHPEPKTPVAPNLEPTPHVRTLGETPDLPDLSAYVKRHELAPYVQAEELGEALDVVESRITKDQGNINDLFDSKLKGLVSRVDEIQLAKPTIVHIHNHKTNELTKLEGVQHMHFPELLTICNSRTDTGQTYNIWLHGPAATGKSTAGAMAAIALYGKRRFYTNNKLSGDHQAMGFINAYGYQRTQFRDAYEHGGIYLGDEIDGSQPDALIAFNNALANDECPFPDATIKKHPDFIFIGAANTTGSGGSIQYLARMKQDAAFSDRFVFLDWPHDNALEDSLVQNKDWLRVVRRAREVAKNQGLVEHLITMRAALFGSGLLRGGLAYDRVLLRTIKKGMTEAQWSNMRPRLPMTLTGA